VEADQLKTKRLDHLGIVAGICQQIDLIGQIDAQIGSQERKVSVGQAVQAMVLNGLGFVSRPLYLTPEFYANKPLDRLIGAGIEAEDLNDDSLGRALDWLYRAGVTEVFAQVSAHALRVFGIETRYAHLDTTAFSFYGNYPSEEQAASPTAESDPVPIQITHGYSKDHRPDLKQAVLAMICANRASLPVWIAALSGNKADKSSFPEVASAYLSQFEAADMPYLVADSALYGAETLKTLSAVKWVTRVPATITEAKHRLDSTEPARMQPTPLAGYLIDEVPMRYADLEQRWVMVLYEPRRQRELNALERQVSKEYEQAAKTLRKLMRRDFACETDARAAADQLTATWKYHQLVEVKTTSQVRYARSGRPRPETPRQEQWQVSGTLEAHESALAAAQAPLGKSIIATNELDPDQLPAMELLSIYKDQNRTSERGFRFLKDPLFFASRFFLKKPSRIMALLMIMGLSLLVYALAEATLRQQLLQLGEALPDQKGNSTQTPTLRRIFQIFEGIDVLLVQEGGQQRELILNLRDIHHRILAFFSLHVQKIYGLA
jgi:transposase